MTEQLPVPVSLIFCDDVMHDRQKEKFHLIGSFDSVRARALPHVCRSLCVVILLTQGTGTHTGQLVCLAPNGQKAFGSPSRTLHFPSARVVVWAVFRLAGVPFRKVGIYRWQFLCDNQMLTERPFNVLTTGGNGDV